MQNEADSWYDSLSWYGMIHCHGMIHETLARSHELGCMPFETPSLTLGLEKEELSWLFHEKQG